MRAFKLNSKNYLTSNWSGGTTTELYIYPETGSYADRNFEFRFSTARVELESSHFTSLPDINRVLLILEGKITLHHENHYQKSLKKFEIDSFPGHWNTASFGKCVDFNVMTKDPWHPNLTVLNLEANEKHIFTSLSEAKFLFFHLPFGKITLHIDPEFHTLIAGESLCIADPQNISFSISSDEHSSLVISEMLYP